MFGITIIKNATNKRGVFMDLKNGDTTERYIADRNCGFANLSGISNKDEKILSRIFSEKKLFFSLDFHFLIVYTYIFSILRLNRYEIH